LPVGIGHEHATYHGIVLAQLEVLPVCFIVMFSELALVPVTVLACTTFATTKYLPCTNLLKELFCSVEQSLKVAFFFSFEKKSSVRGKGGHVFLKGKCAAQKRFQLL
jgi:hypothetical protein